ncbi:MAG: OsmC family protein [Crocinitomicaceae bacterium]|nr:OsmC family protein [Crocinitomicaceae bacterium]
MGITLTRIDKPYVFEFENERGIKCLIDAAPGIGGTDRGFRPMELLGGALAGCVAIDVLGILKKQRFDPSLFKITINSKRKEGIPSPFESFLLSVEVDESIDKIKLDKNVKLVIEKYCSVVASLDKNIVIRHEII